MLPEAPEDRAFGEATGAEPRGKGVSSGSQDWLVGRGAGRRAGLLALAVLKPVHEGTLTGTAQIAAKTTRDSQGVAVVTLKKNQTIASVVPADTLELANPHRYRVRSLPATGALVRVEDEGEQMTML